MIGEVRKTARRLETHHRRRRRPIFAAEVRGEGDYGAAAEREIVAKRDDYFAAGTRVVWDVDLLSDSAIVRAYSIEDPMRALPFARGELARADDAVPDWSMPVDELFLDG